MNVRKILNRAGLGCILFASPGWAFDYSRYKPTDFDQVIQQARPPAGLGVDINSPQKKLRLSATLVQQAQACNNRFLKTTMATAGIPKDFVDSIPISKCIQIRSTGGKVVTAFIQDVLADPLSKEIAVGGRVTLFVDFLYVGQNGPGILVNEFDGTQ